MPLEVATLVDDTGELIGALAGADAARELETAWVGGDALPLPDERRRVTRPGRPGWFSSGDATATLCVVRVESPPVTVEAPHLMCLALAQHRRWSAESVSTVRAILAVAPPGLLPEVQSDLRMLIAAWDGTAQCDPDAILRERIARGSPVEEMLSALLMAGRPPPASLPPGAIPEAFSRAFATQTCGGAPPPGPGTPPAAPAARTPPGSP
jgi:hypothetical protein